MQIKIVRHYRGPEDADRDIQHSGITNDLRGRDEKSLGNAQQAGLGEEYLQSEADPDHPNERNHERLDQAKSLLLQKENQQNVERGQANAPQQWDVKQQIE